MPNQKRISFIIIVLLLVVFLPLSIFGFVGKKAIEKEENNPNHDMYYKGYVWFYDGDNYLSKYECVNEDCELAKTIIDDDEYSINYYKEGKDNKTSVINNKYAFIKDGDEINLFDVSIGSVITKYKALKNYYTNLFNNTFIVQNNNNKWGVLNFSGELRAIIPFEYDYIGLVEELDSEKQLDTFLTKKEGSWKIVNSFNEPMSETYYNNIIYYNDKYIFIKNTDNYIKIYDYDNNEYLSEQKIDNFYIVDKYTIIISSNILYIYNNLSNSYLKSIFIKNSPNLLFEFNEPNIIIKDGENIIDTVEL